jgi:hypothetical protein
MLSEEYQSWNTAIAEAVYNSDSAGSPVYLDLDDSKFELITQHLALIEFDATRAGLASAVRNAMDFSAPKSRLLWPIVRESRAWMSKLLKRENPDGSPPMIAFLAVAVLAAEEMGNGEANANAYYAQLFKLLWYADGGSAFPSLCLSCDVASARARGGSTQTGSNV